MATLETEICFLSGEEARAWEFHSKPPARCDKSVHAHVSESEARKMCLAGEAQLSYIRGRWCLMPKNSKRGYAVRLSAGYVGLQLVAD
jgi:hypothetical protein